MEDSLQPIIFDVQERVYKLRKDELELSVNDTLLVQEAQKRKVTTNALLDAEVKPKAVTEEQARVFFEQNKDRVSGDFAQTRDSIIRYLEQIEVRVAERAFVEKLRAAASIQIFLVAPESPVFSISTADQPSLGSADGSGYSCRIYGLPMSELRSDPPGSRASGQGVRRQSKARHARLSTHPACRSLQGGGSRRSCPRTGQILGIRATTDAQSIGVERGQAEGVCK